MPDQLPSLVKLFESGGINLAAIAAVLFLTPFVRSLFKMKKRKVPIVPGILGFLLAGLDVARRAAMGDAEMPPGFFQGLVWFLIEFVWQGIIWAGVASWIYNVKKKTFAGAGTDNTA